MLCQLAQFWQIKGLVSRDKLQICKRYWFWDPSTIRNIDHGTFSNFATKLHMDAKDSLWWSFCQRTKACPSDSQCHSFFLARLTKLNCPSDLLLYRPVSWSVEWRSGIWIVLNKLCTTLWTDSCSALRHYRSGGLTHHICSSQLMRGGALWWDYPPC